MVSQLSKAKKAWAKQYNNAMANTIYYQPTSATNSTVYVQPVTNGAWVTTSSTTGTIPTWVPMHPSQVPGPARKTPGGYNIAGGRDAKITMPDGTIIEMLADGSYTINDKDAKVIYRGTKTRDFNPFINASDKLEGFIQYCGTIGIKQDEMLKLPLDLFVAWLIIEAAKADLEPEPDLKLLPNLRKVQKPHCPSCGRFVKLRHKAVGINHCGTVCFEKGIRNVEASTQLLLPHERGKALTSAS